MDCRTCRGPVQAGFARCYQCDLAHGRFGGLLADAVVPVAYAVKGGRLAADLWRYKSGLPGAAEAGARLTAMLSGFLHEHASRVWRLAGMDGGPAVAAVVPSGQGRLGAHPLLSIVASCVDLPVVQLSAANGALPRGRGLGDDIGVGWLTVAGPVGGADVLLVDDTWVSGGSAQSAAAALKTAGARRVALVVLGRHIDPADPRSAEFLRAKKERAKSAQSTLRELSDLSSWKRLKGILSSRFALTGHYGNSGALIARSATVLVKVFGGHYFASMEASEIVAALRGNEADAPAELFDNYGEQLIAYCWQLLRDEDATLIAVRDTMIVAQAHAGRLRDPELIAPWLLALARVECERRARAAAGHAAKAAKTAMAGDAGDAPPDAAAMRDEILTCLSDPRQARYRAVAAARLAKLDTTGFPTGADDSRAARWPRWRRGTGRAALDATRFPAGGRWRPCRRPLHLGGGLLTAGVACTAVVILLAAGVSLHGATAPAAPAASASSSDAAPGGPALAASASPQDRPVAVTSLAPRSPDLNTPGQQTPGQTKQALYDISSQPGAPGRPLRGGQAPPVPQGMPPVPVPTTSGPWFTSSGAPPTGPPWPQPPGRHWSPPESPTSSPASPTPSPWSPEPWPTAPEGRTWPRQPATSTPAAQPIATMAAAWSPGTATSAPWPEPTATSVPVENPAPQAHRQARRHKCP